MVPMEDPACAHAPSELIEPRVAVRVRAWGFVHHKNIATLPGKRFPHIRKDRRTVPARQASAPEIAFACMDDEACSGGMQRLRRWHPYLTAKHASQPCDGQTRNLYDPAIERAVGERRSRTDGHSHWPYPCRDCPGSRTAQCSPGPARARLRAGRGAWMSPSSTTASGACPATAWMMWSNLPCGSPQKRIIRESSYASARDGKFGTRRTRPSCEGSRVKRV